MTTSGRILMVNKFFHRRGGTEAYVSYLTELLAGVGYDVVPFAMAHPENDATPYSVFFVPRVDLVDSLRSPSLLRRARVAARVVYSTEAARRIKQVCRAMRPDIAHLHNIYHQLSPSVLGALKRQQIPVVMTLHDYKLICPAYLLLAPDGICERCRGGRFHHAVIHRCSKNSLSASLLVTAEAYFHRFLKSYDNVDVFVCPSRFLLEKMAANGLPRAKLVHIPNFAPVDEFQPAGSAAHGEYVIYFGRLSPEKGLGTLLKAMSSIRDIPLVVVGDGPSREELATQAKDLRLSNVSFLPRVEKHMLSELVGKARFAVLPSESYENCSISVLESFAWGRAVIGSRLGGTPELVEDGVTGLLFQPGNPDDLAAKIDLLFGRPKMAGELGSLARRRAETELDPHHHIEAITRVYRKVRVDTGAAQERVAIAGDLNNRRLDE